MARVFDLPQSKSSEWASSLENYLLLQSQQERLRRRLSINPNSPPSVSPPSISPTTRSPYDSTFSSPKASFSFPAHSPAHELPEVFSSSVQDDDSARKLRDVSQQIKLTLTDLLNCERGRTDEAFRAWIQDRLMEAEHELKRQRRRHSSSDKEAADVIGEHFVGRYRY